LKSCFYLLIFLGLVLTVSVRAEQEAGNAKLSDFKLPQYNEKGRLVFILYGKSGYSAGINVFLEQVMIDMVQSTVKDIDTVKDLSAAVLYPIDANPEEVLKFWLDKPHCAALIAAPSAIFDRAAQTVKGDRTIRLRSPTIDVDGEGFDGEYAGRTLHIRKNVTIVVRRPMPGPGNKEKKAENRRETTSELPEKITPQTDVKENNHENVQ